MTPELKADLTELLVILNRIPPIVAQEKDHETGANIGAPISTILAQVPEVLVRRLERHMEVRT